MKTSLFNRLTSIVERYEELAALLGDMGVIRDQNHFRKLSKEYVQLGAVVQCFQQYRTNLDILNQAEQCLQDPDLTVRHLAEEEVKTAQLKQIALEKELERLLLPQDPNDQRNVFLEIRAAAGGDEAAIFAGDLYRMYSRYAENQAWAVELIHRVSRVVIRKSLRVFLVRPCIHI